MFFFKTKDIIKLIGFDFPIFPIIQFWESGSLKLKLKLILTMIIIIYYYHEIYDDGYYHYIIIIILLLTLLLSYIIMMIMMIMSSGEECQWVARVVRNKKKPDMINMINGLIEYHHQPARYMGFCQASSPPISVWWQGHFFGHNPRHHVLDSPDPLTQK